MNDETPPYQLIPKKYRIPLIACLVIVFLWAAVLCIALILPVTEEGNYKEMFGQVGDAFGMLNSLIGGLTIVFALYTINENREMMKNQEAQYRQERLDSRNAVIATKLEDAGLKINALGSEAIILCSKIQSRFQLNPSELAEDFRKHNHTLIDISFLSAMHFPELREQLQKLTENAASILRIALTVYDAYNQKEKSSKEIEQIENLAIINLKEASKTYAKVGRSLIEHIDKLRRETTQADTACK